MTEPAGPTSPGIFSARKRSRCPLKSAQKTCQTRAKKGTCELQLQPAPIRRSSSCKRKLGRRKRPCRPFSNSAWTSSGSCASAMADTCESGKTAHAVCAGRWSTRETREVHTNPKSQCRTKLQADSVTIRFRVLPPPSRLRLQGGSLARSFDLSRITDGTTAQTPAPHSAAGHRTCSVSALCTCLGPRSSWSLLRLRLLTPLFASGTVFRGKARSRAKRLSVPGQRAGPAALPALGHACLDVPQLCSCASEISICRGERYML